MQSVSYAIVTAGAFSEEQDCQVKTLNKITEETSDKIMPLTYLPENNARYNIL